MIISFSLRLIFSRLLWLWWFSTSLLVLRSFYHIFWEGQHLLFWLGLSSLKLIVQLTLFQVEPSVVTDRLSDYNDRPHFFGLQFPPLWSSSPSVSIIGKGFILLFGKSLPFIQRVLQRLAQIIMTIQDVLSAHSASNSDPTSSTFFAILVTSSTPFLPSTPWSN